ncbi:unnamed protein product, partial [Musa banksii]
RERNILLDQQHFCSTSHDKVEEHTDKNLLPHRLGIFRAPSATLYHESHGVEPRQPTPDGRRCGSRTQHALTKALNPRNQKHQSSAWCKNEGEGDDPDSQFQ